MTTVRYTQMTFLPSKSYSRFRFALWSFSFIPSTVRNVQIVNEMLINNVPNRTLIDIRGQYRPRKKNIVLHCLHLHCVIMGKPKKNLKNSILLSSEGNTIILENPHTPSPPTSFPLQVDYLITLLNV